MRLLCITLGLIVIVFFAPTIQAEYLLPPESPVPCPEGAVVDLMYGEHTTGCTIGVVTDLDTFTFEGIAGDEIRITLRTDTGMDPCIEIREPGNPDPIETLCCTGACTIREEDFALNFTGTYLLAVSERESDQTGSYVLQLEKIPPIAAPLSLSIPYDFAVSETVSPQTDLDFIKFEGADGTLVRVTRRTNTGMDPRLEIWDPAHAKIKDVSCIGACTISEDLSLISSGTYLIGISEVFGDQTGGYEINIQCLFGDCPDDLDQDTVSDLTDNCFREPNVNQCDTDMDDIGNFCDPDLNNDGSVNFGDLAEMKQVFFGTDPVADLNCDGFVNFADLATMKRHFFTPPGPSGLAP